MELRPSCYVTRTGVIFTVNKNNIDWGGWIWAVIMLSVFPPVGIILLIRQIFALGKPSRPQTKRHPYDIQQEAERAAQEAKNTQAKASQAKTAPRSAAKKSKKKKKSEPKHIPGEVSGKVLSIVGISVTGLFLFAMLMSLAEIISYGWYSYYLEELIVFSTFITGGLTCLCLGALRQKKAKRYRKYLSYIGKNKTVSLSALASAMGKWERTVRQDLQEMLDLGIIPGYIDMSSKQLILTEEGISESEPAPEKTIEDDYDILREIRAVNDAIPDESMSQKIDRIGEITGKILDYQRSHPNKSSQLRSFLNYYLPTTLKVLRAYAQLDAQGIEGENITAAKKRIENMMDQVVYGFEKQLDRLFQDDAMDIASDVEVLENMLRQDGLSGKGAPFAEPAPNPSPNSTEASAQQVCREMENIMKDLEDDQDQGITLQL